jgi:hypothetical protein
LKNYLIMLSIPPARELFTKVAVSDLCIFQTFTVAAQCWIFTNFQQYFFNTR